ncbi:MAG: aspartate aminotransferase family protein [Chloroflexi bacterium]|nr:aspartate aminotransferase family protein [Chloroflexota bacterium]MBI3739429.1 aspartate aminotransferase family protein [Chloroflexota bacterium]
MERKLTIQELESQYTSGLYIKRPIAIVRGKGARVWDSDGREYIDCAGGQGTANVGHANPAVADAIAEQARTLIALTEVFYNDKRARVEEKLCAISPNHANRVYLCNSGTEAIEAAIKFSRYSTKRTGIVAMMRGFHGRTMGALSATWDPHYREPFMPLVPDFSHIPYDNLDKARAAITEKTAGVIVEVVQGEGGVRPGSREFLIGLQNLCRERGALLIIDEVQTGFGRTGKMFASEHFGLEGDFVCVAKSIAGGLPMGAVMMSERVKKLEPMIHGSTFGGNPLACAASIAAIDFMEKENLSARAAELGEYAKGRLQRIESPLIREVRGMGLLLGIELKKKVTPFLLALLERGVLALPAGPTVLRLLPPLVIEKADIDRVVDEIEFVLNNVKEESADV